MSIVLERITKRFDGLPAVDDVSIEIADGELFVLLGASGSGKSTILRLIAGLLHLDGGRILLHGRRVDDLPPQKRGVGYVFQNYALFRHMTVAENIEFGLKIRGAAARERARRRDELLELVGLTGFGHRSTLQLSGGQMQRVAVARALAYGPEVLLLDEPFGALDVKIRAQLRGSLKTIQRELGVTTILVTHDQEEAFELGDRIGVMERGRLLEVGRPVDLYRQPAGEFVATFLGTANIVAGRMEGGKVRLGAILLDPPPGTARFPERATVSVLFRPEELDVARQPERLEGAPIGVATVIDRTFAGSLERLFLWVPGLRGAHAISPKPAYGESETVVQSVVRFAGVEDGSFKVGEEVHVALRSFHVLPHAGLRVLVCSDGSEKSADAVRFGLLLAKAMEGPLTLLGVAPDDELERGLSARLAALVPQGERGTAMAGGAFSVRTRRGDAAREIIHELEERPYDLAVLGSVGEGGAQEVGSTAAAVAQRLNVPVLIVPAGAPKRTAIARILICTAAGEPGKADIEFGGRIARRAGAEVTILHVRTDGLAPPPPVGAPAPAPAPELAGQDLEPATVTHLEKGLRTLGRFAVAGQVKIRHGPVVQEIFDEADSGDYDLLVIGAHVAEARGRGVLPNDVAHAVVTEARRPVVMVPLRTD